MDNASPGSQPNAMPDGTVVFTASGIRRGVRMAVPFGVGSIVYGMAFGLIARDAHLSSLEATLMSLLVFSGTAQVAALQMWSATPGALTIFLAVLIANSRYILMSAALRPWLGQLSTWKSHLPLYILVDGGFAMATRSYSEGNRDAGVLFGACVLSYATWSVGTLLGTLSGQLIANPRAIGLDFVVIAFCASSIVVMARSASDLRPALAALVVVCALERLSPGPWVVIAAGLVGAFAGAILHRDEPGRGKLPT